MTEIDEVAAAIQAKYPGLFPLTLMQARYVASKEAGDQGCAIIGQLVDALMKLKGTGLEWKETFRADLFDALHASTLALVYDEAYELIGEAQGFFPVGDMVRIEVGTDEIDFKDQQVAIGPDGACGVISSTGRALFMELAMSRPFTSADLEAYKCKQSPATPTP